MLQFRGQSKPQPTMQNELFDNARSHAPHLDPARAVDITISNEQDRDFVADPVNGYLPIGALGSNREVWVVRVSDGGDVLFAESFSREGDAINCRTEIQVTRERNK